jgi:glycolate oxidase FAD binding subunit
MSSSAGWKVEEGAVRLSTIVGSDFVRWDGTSMTVIPGNVEEIVEVLRFANSNSLTVAPNGGRTKLRWGNSVRPDILLGTGRLSALREHTWQDMTCTVEAGCTWGDIQRALRRHRQMVALDTLWPDRATVGGVVATNDSGVLRLKYGGLRDLIIGMTLVLADGTVARSGGKVVKNVAGYDLHKLMIGGFGTLGVITSVNFRLHPIEEHRQSWTIRAKDPALFRQPVAALLDSQAVLTSLQIRCVEQECALDVSIAGLPETLKDAGDMVRRMFGALEVVESGEDVWLARQKLFDKDGDLILKISVLPSEMCSVISDARQYAAEMAAECAIVAQGTGLMTVALSSPSESAIAFIDRLRAQLRGAWGSLVVLQVPETFRGHVDVWGTLPGSIELMREIKKRFDPEGTLNPGRFVGSI